MKGDESPDVSKRNMERDIKILQQISCTPKGKKIGLDDLHLLGLHRDCSPNAYGSSQDKLEIGWGDSPEPLNIEQKAKMYATPVSCKKRLEAKESPKSRCRYIRPSIRPPSKPPVDVSKYIAEVQALSERIMNGIEKKKNLIRDGTPEKENAEEKSIMGDISDLFNGDDSTNEYLIACSQSLENKLASTKENPKKSEVADAVESKQQNDSVASGDSAFERVLQSFISEEDDWLSQVVINVEPRMTPRKKGFFKTKSENHLTSTEVNTPPARRPSGSSGTFRRTHSSDRVTSNDFSKNNPSCRGRKWGLANESAQGPQRKGFR